MYQVFREQWPAALISQGLKTAYEVAYIRHNAPAQQTGIKPGWRIIQLNNFDTLNGDAIDMARAQGISQIVFLPDPNSTEVVIVTGTNWPNGMVVIPCVTDTLKSEIASGNYDTMLLDKIWGEGAWTRFALLTESFQTALTPVLKRLLPGRLAGDPLVHAFKSDDYLSQLYLSLCYLARGDMQIAADLRNRAVENYEKTDIPHPSSFYALMDFIEAEIAFNTGHVDTAKEIIDHTSNYAPEIYLISQKYAEYTRNPPVMRWSDWMQKRFPIDYDLPCTDPLGRLTRPGDRATLATTLADMRPTQVHLVYLMGPYRRNRPFFREMVGLASLVRMDPNRIASAHVIVGRVDEDKLWKGFDAYEDFVRDTGLDFRLATDEADTMMDRLNLSSCPSLFVLSKDGTVLSVDYMDDETGYWTAIDRLSDPAFQTEVSQRAKTDQNGLPPQD